MSEDRDRVPGVPPSGDASRPEPLGESWLDPRLEEAAAAERERAPTDAERFFARLDQRLATSPGTGRALRLPAVSWAAIIPIALALWWLFGGSFAPDRAPTSPGDGALAAESALIEELDVLELLADLVPAGEEELDPELIDLYVDFEIIEELPVETLGSSG